MDKKSLTGHILFQLHQTKHWVYFALIFCVAVGIWSIFFEDTKKNIENVQLSSFSESLAEVNKIKLRKAEIAAINRLSVRPAVKELNAKKLPPRFKDNPAFKLFVFVEEMMSKPDQAPDGALSRKIASDPSAEKK